MFLTIIVFLITLLILVISHELGHFAAAKKFGIKVLEFGFGLPPKIWGKRKGETTYSINALPIGGFVRLLGEDDTDPEVLKSKRSFTNKPVWQRIVVVTAGVTMNFLLAVIIFTAVLAFTGFKEEIPLLKPYRFVGVVQSDKSLVLVGNIAKDSPAEKAGFKLGDQVTAINGQKVGNSQQMIEVTKANAGKEVVMTVLDQSKSERMVKVTPRLNPPPNQGPLGVELVTMSVAEITYPTLTQKAASGVIHSINITTYSMAILGDLIADSWKSKNIAPVSDSLSGPVGITNITSAILQTQSPLAPFLNFMAILSLNLAIINILPFPALDGGRLVFLLVELIARRRVKAEVERWVHTAGMVFLIALIILITLSDIRKFF